MKRNLYYQFILFVIIAAFAYVIISTTQANLAQLGVESSLGFLWKRAGFEISQTLIPYSANSTIARAFIVALLNTLVLAFVAIICATILGLIIGVARLSGNWLTAALAAAYIELFRNIPSLLQIFFWYFVALRSLPRSRDSLSLHDLFFLNNRGLFMPAPVMDHGVTAVVIAFFVAVAGAVMLNKWAAGRQYVTGRRFPVVTTGLLLVIGLPVIVMTITGVSWEIPHSGRFSYQGGMVIMPEFIALVVGLSMYNATYIAEIVRSGFQSIATGQTEAAYSLGLSHYQTLRLVLFPQTLRVIIPPLTTVYLNMFKSTSLAAAIAYPEIVSVFIGTVNNLVGQPVIIMAITLVIYTLISLCIAIFLNWYNKRIALTTR